MTGTNRELWGSAARPGNPDWIVDPDTARDGTSRWPPRPIRDQLCGCGFAGGRGLDGFTGRGAEAGRLGCNVTVTGFGL
jgi:hypothetical protein